MIMPPWKDSWKPSKYDYMKKKLNTFLYFVFGYMKKKILFHIMKSLLLIKCVNAGNQANDINRNIWSWETIYKRSYWSDGIY